MLSSWWFGSYQNYNGHREYSLHVKLDEQPVEIYDFTASAKLKWEVVILHRLIEILEKNNQDMALNIFQYMKDIHFNHSRSFQDQLFLYQEHNLLENFLPEVVRHITRFENLKVYW